MRRNWVRAVARGLVGVVLMAQLAIAAYACPALSVAKVANVPEALASEMGAAEPGMPMAGGANCDDMAGGSIDPSAPNLCAEHCKVGQQSDQAQTITVPAVVLTPLYATPLVPQTALPPRIAAATMSALVAASPPHAILHCVFRT